MAEIRCHTSECNRDYSIWKQFLPTLPSVFQQEGDVLYSKRNVVKQLTVEGRVCVVKRYKRMNLFQHVASLFGHKSKAYKSFHNAGELQERGFSAPSPIGYVECRRGCFVTDCYYVCAYDDGAPVRDAFCGNTGRDEVREAFPGFVARLHRAGVLFDDLNSTNTLFHSDPSSGITFSLIDINRIRFLEKGQLPPLKDCLENLTLFTGDMDLFRSVAASYAMLMHGSFGMTASQLTDMALRRKIAHDRSWRRRKRILHPFRKRKKR